ncbi:hypothetical protein R1sor_016692 [Riccia sorocarpa]|uniref:cGMP-dependent protein kinase n=1 Tax=Riccia sorocarpa TaxID=122646 RepID=A0ABD3HG69_9MARC
MQPEPTEKEELNLVDKKPESNAVSSSEVPIPNLNGMEVTGNSLKDSQAGQGLSRRCSRRCITKMELELIHTEGAFSVLKAVGQCLVEEEKEIPQQSNDPKQSCKSLIQGFESNFGTATVNKETVKDQALVAGLLPKMESASIDNANSVVVSRTDEMKASGKGCKSLVEFFESKMEGVTTSEKKGKDEDDVVESLPKVEPDSTELGNIDLGMNTDSKDQVGHNTSEAIPEERKEPTKSFEYLHEDLETKLEPPAVKNERVEDKDTEENTQSEDAARSPVKIEPELNNTKEPIFMVRAENEEQADVGQREAIPEELEHQKNSECKTNASDNELENIAVSQKVALGFTTNTEQELNQTIGSVSELNTTNSHLEEGRNIIPEQTEQSEQDGSDLKVEIVAASKDGGKEQDVVEGATSFLETMSEGQVDADNTILSKEKRVPRQRSKSLSIGDLEIKTKTLARDVSQSIDKIRKRSHVPLTVLERMQKDPIVAQHFAQLESSTEETISGSSDDSKRLLHTTNRLRRTTDSLGLKYVNQYIVIKILGRGTYGKVKLCLNTMDCKLYAVKIVHRKWMAGRIIGGTTEDVGHGAMREIAIMKKLNHPNIVALHEVIDDPTKKKLYLVLEYVEGGPIMGNQKWNPFHEDKARLYFRDMCKGIDYLHFNKIVHRDLKPGNLLETLNGTVKITDFGVSHMFEQESDSMHGRAGTPAFLAPEVCSGCECQGRPADIWSLGVCLYVMVFGKIPFPADSIAEMYQAIIYKETVILSKDPATRISLAGIMQHEWVTKEGLEPLVPYKVQVARGSTTMSVTEAEVKAAVGVNKSGLAALCSINPDEKVFEEGEYIIRQGEEGNEMYFINSGQCEVLVESRSLTQPSRGRMEYAVAERGPGQYIGEMELQKDPGRKPPKRNASIRAKTRVVALVVSREKVVEVLSKNTEAAQSMAETIAERDRELQMKLRALDLRMPSMKVEKEEEPAPAPQRQETCASCR